ncbi:tRNA:m4X modification enzyme, partial [Paragonimus westermani]
DFFDFQFDTRNRDIGNFTRVRMDIAQLDLKSLPSFQNRCKPIVAIAKHLCGDATDLALRCLKNASTKNEKNDQVIRLGGLMFAVCCHHRCSWEEAVGRPWLEREARLTSREFAIATRLTSWATCGFKRKQPDIAEPSPQTEVLPIHFDESSNSACCSDELTDFSAYVRPL